ncbi:3-deoxy-manno-octulosonate cytidylyltransferase [Candidatus Kaiserbacteria bacterium]|nr:3-deoxy-manno-octulosonate cytidylyltransferase [Candidatus Kaiserbacteria bacterium]
MNKKKPHVIAIIPARMGSTRFPGKHLQDIHGMPMLGHVYHRTKMSPVLDEVYLAVSGKELEGFADSIGAKWIPDQKESYRGCGDAIADATTEIERRIGKKVDIVVLVQGDEPMVVPEMIDMAVAPMLENPEIKVINLMAPIRSDEEHEDVNCPKVVVDKNNYALYFSREPIPSKKKWKGGDIPRYKQVCIIPYNRDFLAELSDMQPGVIEEIESIDMNRVLEYGHRVKMVPEDFETYAVDTPPDIERVRRFMKDDPLMKHYVRR